MNPPDLKLILPVQMKNNNSNKNLYNNKKILWHKVDEFLASSSNLKKMINGCRFQVSIKYSLDIHWSDVIQKPWCFLVRFSFLNVSWSQLGSYISNMVIVCNQTTTINKLPVLVLSISPKTLSQQSSLSSDKK